MRTKISYERINQEELQRLQEEFCRATGVCGYCLDKDMHRLTAGSGTAGQLQKLREYEERGVLQTLLERVEEGSLEEQAVEELDGQGDRAAAIAVKADGNIVLYWVAAWISSEIKYPAAGSGILNSRGTCQDPLDLRQLPAEIKSPDDVFQNILDLLWDTSRVFACSRLPSSDGRECGKGTAEEAIGQELSLAEAMSEIIHLLDSDEHMETVMGRWLNIVAEYLQVDTALLFYLNQEKNTVDVLAEWCSSGVVSYFDKSRNQKMTYPWLLTEKPLVYPRDAGEDGYWKTLKEMGVRACMIFPVLCREAGRRLAVVVNHRACVHHFSPQEIRFAGDAVKILQDIVIRRSQKRWLAFSSEALENILDNVACSIYVTDRTTGEPLFANKRLQNEFSAELKSNTMEKLLRKGMEDGKDRGSLEFCHEQKERWYDLAAREIIWGNGQPAMLYSLYDITERKLYQRGMDRQANMDFLTGLYNRMRCERDLARQIDRAKRARRVGALLYLDLDDFKYINDGLGHQYGDALLKAIAHEMQRIRGIEKSCYRVGGDEFGIIISPEEYAEMDRILEDMGEIFAKPWFLKNEDYYCTMSMGIVTYPDLGDSVADLIKKADIAMYEAKKDGRNQIVRYNDRLASMSGRRLDMEKNMRDATAEGYREFEVYYQPIIDVQNGQGICAGAEALIRWNSTKLGFIPPDEFIPLAEYLGLINPIGNYVMREACLQCKKWNDNGYPDYKVNVNLSVVQLLQKDVVEIVEHILDETGIQPRNLTLEVTESLAINDMGRMKEILNRIKALGVKIALDDFGTGYSSLNHIREIPFDLIKVDQSFVKELAADAYSQSFVKMVAELAETLGVSVCVEGIETPEQYKVVQKMKVKYIQGYYFDRPMKQGDFEEKYCSLGQIAI